MFACAFARTMQRSSRSWKFASRPAASPPTPKLSISTIRLSATLWAPIRTTLLDAFESIVRFDIAVATDWVFVHSGVVVWNGAAIAVPAPSMHGKSRLVDALVRAGAIYYSDEYAVIDSQGFVHPFQRPISLRTASGTVRRTMLRNPNFAGAVPLRLVVSTRYEPGAEWRPRRGTAAEALLVLLSNTVRARLAPRETLRVLARAVARAELLEGCRGEAESVALLLLEDQHEA